SIGVITLGNKIVFIEGEDTSLDKDVYQKLIKEKYPKMVLVPSGGKSNLLNFSSVIENLLNKSIWGVEFFILSDQDASPVGSLQNQVLKADGKFRCLGRYHLENYFLDADVIKAVFDEMEPEGSWLRDAVQIENKLNELAKGIVSLAVSLRVSNRIRYDAGNVSLMPKDAHNLSKADLVKAIDQRAIDEQARVVGTLTTTTIETLVNTEYDNINNLLNSGGDWKSVIPGKILLKKFCSEAGIEYAKFKRIYLAKAMLSTNNPFAEILNIFDDFSNA
ncbi:MAG: hypothetical protein DI551_12020, partial [Micavibrio aeruginosavorus]